MRSFEELVAHIDQSGIDNDAAKDIVKLKPDISQQEALAVQLAVKRRREVNGDRIIGHQASFVSSGARTMFPNAPRPMVGTLLASLTRESGDVVELDAETVFVECEIALLLKKDLEGPALTATEILGAIDGFFPAFELGPMRAAARDFSWPHIIAVQKAFGGFIIFGSKMISPKNFDPRLEGCLLSVDGEARVGATGFESMGNPLFAVAGVARGLHAIGEKLKAGQVVMTGNIIPPLSIGPENGHALLEFQTLGSVGVRFKHLTAPTGR